MIFFIAFGLKQNLLLGMKINKIYRFSDFLKQKILPGQNLKTHELTGTN
jgi:hypothetical protein